MGVAPERTAKRAMASDNPLTLTDQNFDANVLASSKPVVVDFWAPWCGPCLALAPAVESLAGVYAGEVTVGKVNVDENPEVSTRYQVRSIPTVIVFRDGQAVDRSVGLVDKSSLQRMVETYIRTSVEQR